MGSSDRRKKIKSRKRKFQGNQHQKPKGNSLEGSQQLTAQSSIESTPTTTSTSVSSTNSNSTISSKTPVPTSASAKKLKVDISLFNDNDIRTPQDISTEGCYVLFDTFIMKEFIENIVRCPVCSSDVTFEHDIKNKQGLCHFLIFLVLVVIL